MGLGLRGANALRYLLWMVAALGALAACDVGPSGLGNGGGGSSHPPTPTPAPIRTPVFMVVNVVPPSGSIYLGAFANPAQVTPPPISALQTLESQVGRTMALSPHYYGFTDKFPGAYEADDAAAGRMPVDSWNCGVPDSAIVAGTQDTLIKNRADALKAYGKPIMLRFMWEMNVPANPNYRAQCYDLATDGPGYAFSPTEFVAAWNHMRQIFVTEGATNVVWVWNPSGVNNPNAYYPGASTVDWVGFDQYDTNSVSFALTYQVPYGYVLPLDKPILIGETGALAPTQPSFFPGGAQILQSTYPAVKGYIYFDAGNLWSLTSAGLPSFTTMANDPYMSAPAP